MKFGDIITTIASLTIIMVFIAVPLELLFFSTLGFYMGHTVSVTIAMLLAPLITGYIFAAKIWEARREAITKITVLTAALVMLFVMHLPALPEWEPAIKELARNMLGLTTLSTSEWLGVELFALYLNLLQNAGMVIVLSYIGLYIGSALKKPTKS